MTQPSARANRRATPPWLRYPLLVLATLLLVPWAKLFPRHWAHVLSRNMTRFLGTFPSYEPSEHDVFVCSYYKSGTNWTMQIALQIAYRGRADYDHIHDLVPWPDMSPRARFAVPLADDGPRRAAPTGLRIVKTHLALDRIPFSPAARYICVVRDPKDVFVSSYHFTRAHIGASMMPPVDAWLDAYLSPDTALGSWAHHLQSYWTVRGRANVLFLTYEAMRADLSGTVDRIAAFMSVELAADEKAAVVAQSTFAHMKAIEDRFDTPGAPWTTASGTMMRRGERGKSDELISAAEQRRIDDYWRAELVASGCDFPYGTAFGLAPSAEPVAVSAPARAGAR